MLQPGGRLVIACSGPDSDARLALEVTADCYLQYRTPAMMLQLASDVSDAARVDLQTDSTGLNYYLVIDRAPRLQQV